jgi:dipeptidyl aminopeptidase/acylaminoacyl peptidase
VLQINYRGSTGYGQAFRDAGNRRWADTIPQDVVAGTKWAIEHREAEPGRICAMGVGFGAYVALESVIQESGLFACAVGRAGIYDLGLLYRGGQTFVENMYHLAQDRDRLTPLEEAIGRNDEELERASPVNQVALLDVPVLIAHDKADGDVRFEHARRLREQLDRQAKDYQWLESSADSFYDQDVEVGFLEATLEFLAKHTRGSSTSP